ncbi:O-methyltransferase [Erythrobacter litoralis]|uniref:O-methyltransferase n=1 Tax=Erythrobacter litoralis (strain HTCC2594) TaxID=314225 RepID=Q2NB61_ERYLH|nr:O-methyltransferase [Erythrobacter litoralis]ABC63080.1 O-methyltransferase [Erythrobacter litoralis HTCC2594]
MSGVAGWKAVNPLWSAVDDMIGEALLEDGPVLADCAARNAERGLPDIAVSPAQGRFLQMVCEIMGARRALEIGTLGGFSTLFLARGVGETGRVVTLEAKKTYASVARKNFDESGIGDRIEMKVAAALESLATLEGPFDLTFIDADKPNNVNYVEHALRLSRPGALIIVDNVVREGNILEPDEDDESAKGTRALYEHVNNHPRLEATALQTVGAKGWDGMMFLRVRD